MCFGETPMVLRSTLEVRHASYPGFLPGGPAARRGQMPFRSYLCGLCLACSGIPCVPSGAYGADESWAPEPQGSRTKNSTSAQGFMPVPILVVGYFLDE